jgi:hypothetical protein
MEWPSKRFYELTAAATAPPIAAPRVRALRRDVQLWHGRREGQLLVRRRSRAGADACGRERGLPLPGLPSNADRLGSAPHMIIHRLLRLALACAMFAATTLAARAANISILGKWEIVEAVPAPWAQPNNRSTLAAIGQRVLQTMVTFSPQAMDSKFKPFNCKQHVLYESNVLEVDALFQGNLPEPNPSVAAARLGFRKGDVPGVDVRCLKETFTFHFRDPDTALISYDRIILTLKRR